MALLLVYSVKKKRCRFGKQRIKHMKNVGLYIHEIGNLVSVEGCDFHGIGFCSEFSLT